ncbi:spermatogenesis-associated protein 46 isoform X2 [Manis javanica]|uniref:spermatogenesis-associated protein 46 isoform X2 n=1 Tax=Manis javanica TaxID=9974 RepID=UPI003C6D2EAD
MEKFSLLSISEPQISSSVLSTFPNIMSSHGTSLPDGVLGDPQNGEQLRRNCAIYRPWFSPYSYFICTDKGSHLETYGLPEGRPRLPEDPARSSPSSSSSAENPCPRGATEKSRHGQDPGDSITTQDILMASKWYQVQQNGYKCAACCRMYPTLHSLKSHVKWGFKEGFSCRVHYRKLKAYWAKGRARPGDTPSGGSSQAFK